MAQCGRCGQETDDLRVLRCRGEHRKRERVCAHCQVEARTLGQVTDSNARWDRIFQKFVDPDYYAFPLPTMQSSFVAFASQLEVLSR